jgi:hypothetical protein
MACVAGVVWSQGWSQGREAPERYIIALPARCLLIAGKVRQLTQKSAYQRYGGQKETSDDLEKIL